MDSCDDVDTMLMKRRQKFLDDYEHLDSLLCQITVSRNYNIIKPIIIFIIMFCFLLVSYYFMCCIAS